MIDLRKGEPGDSSYWASERGFVRRFGLVGRPRVGGESRSSDDGWRGVIDRSLHGAAGETASDGSFESGKLGDRNTKATRQQVVRKSQEERNCLLLRFPVIDLIYGQGGQARNEIEGQRWSRCCPIRGMGRGVLRDDANHRCGMQARTRFWASLDGWPGTFRPSGFKQTQIPFVMANLVGPLPLSQRNHKYRRVMAA